MVKSLLKIIKQTLKSGEDVLISGFGEFCLKGKGEKHNKKSSNHA
ncbi:MAG: HU family DNA-binding protein [Thermodesulfobacteriota bacterium]